MMRCEEMSKKIRDKYIIPGNHAKSNYFAAISELVRLGDTGPVNRPFYQKEIDAIYSLVRDEILTSQARPISPVKFGPSGWRDMTGLDPIIDRDFLESKARESGPFEERWVNGDSAARGFTSLDGLFKQLMAGGEA